MNDSKPRTEKCKRCQTIVTFAKGTAGRHICRKGKMADLPLSQRDPAAWERALQAGQTRHAPAPPTIDEDLNR